MEHLAHVVEAILAVFGGLRFMHECYEVVHHVVHMIKK